MIPSKDFTLGEGMSLTINCNIFSDYQNIQTAVYKDQVKMPLTFFFKLFKTKTFKTK